MNNMVGLDHDMSLNTVIVVAESYWQAKKAVDLLEVEYQPGEGTALSSDKIAAENQAMLDGGELAQAVDRGQASALIQQAVGSTRLHQAHYSAPYLAHATMEPCNATSHYTAGRIETWGPFQGQDMVRSVLAKMFGLKPADVVVNTTYLGGSFGRKYLPDAVMHATVASKAVGSRLRLFTHARSTSVMNTIAPAVSVITRHCWMKTAIRRLCGRVMPASRCSGRCGAKRCMRRAAGMKAWWSVSIARRIRSLT